MKKILLVFLPLIINTTLLAQNTDPNDCVNAIVVCGNGVFNSSASGPGAKTTEVAGCIGGEHNTVWLKITIASTVIPGSKLGFDLIPNDPDISVDFDFWVFDKNRSCANLGTAIRCCASNPVEAGAPNNHTGIDGSTLATTAWSGSKNPPGNNLSYVQWLPVSPGETYYIAVDRPYNNPPPSGDLGFQIQWTGTATSGAGAFPAAPIANKINDLVKCGTVGFFNLPLEAGPQINSDPTSIITYYSTLQNAIDGKSPLVGPVSVSTAASPKHVYAKVVNGAVGPAAGCFNITDFNLRVYPIPTANISLSKTQVCGSENVTVTFTGTPGATVDYTIDSGPVQSGLLDAANGTYAFTELVSANRIYDLVRVKVLDGSTPPKEICFTDYSTDSSKSVSVKFNSLPTISGILSACQGGTTQLNALPTPTGSFLWTSDKTAVATVNSTGLVNGVSAGTANITYTDSNGCSAISLITVSASPTISGNTTTCVNGSTQLTGSTQASLNSWSTSDSSVATVDSAGLVTGISVGTATITYTDKNGCSANLDVDVVPSVTVDSATAEVTGSFAENKTVTITVLPAGSYLYSLDGGGPQESNVFTNVPSGKHIVKVTDAQGCLDKDVPFEVIGYPHFFTPNGDSANDTWNITSLAETQPDAEIFIFDRYGKLLKRITPGGAGWDGTYNGQPMPSSDYWFTIRYMEDGVEKLFKSHFSLVR